MTRNHARQESLEVINTCKFGLCLSTILQLLILQGDDDLSKQQGINAPPDSVAFLVSREYGLSLEGPTLSVAAQELLYKSR